MQDRACGGPFSALQRLNVCRTAQILDEMWMCQTALRALSQKIYADLYEVICTVAQVEARAALIRLRRAVLSESDVTSGMLAQVQSSLPSLVQPAIQQYMQQQETHRCLHKQGEGLSP